VNDIIPIEEPVFIRFYTPGGRGGYGFQSTRWHRLTGRGPIKDYTACGDSASPEWRTSIKESLTPRTQGNFALCPKCWPEAVR
jgi:hypothetical protein